MKEITGKTQYQHRDLEFKGPRRVEQLSGCTGPVNTPIINHERDAITKPSGAKASKGR
jgi:hypothetical protein